MNDAKFTEVFHSGYNLLEKATGRGFVHFLIFNDIVEEFATGGELHNQVKKLRRLDDFIQLD